MSDLLITDWSEVMISDIITEIQTGVSVNSENRRRGVSEIGILKTSCISRGQFFPEEHKAVLADEVERVKTPLKGESILMSRMNTPNLVGEIGYVQHQNPDIYLPDRLWMFSGKIGTSDTRFLSHLLSSDGFRQELGDIATGTSGSMKNIPQRSFLQIPIQLPPLPEQKKIAEILSGIDHAIQKNTLLLNKVLGIKQGLTMDIFERVQVNSEAIPLDKLLERPLAYGVLKPGPSVSDGVQLVKIQDCTNGCINTRNLYRISKELHHEFRRTELKGGEIILSVVGTIGRVAVVPKELASANVSRAFAVIACHGKINNQYLAHFLDSNRIQQWFKDQCQGNAQQVLNLGTLRELPVPVPSSEEQTEITLSINSIDASIARNRKVLAQLHVLKNAISSDLLSGRKRVTI